MSLVKKTTYFLKNEEIPRKWYVVDATNQTLGRLASNVAKVLRGKHKSVFTPNVDSGDYVVVINAEKVKLASKRLSYKTYFRYTGYPGGARIDKVSDVLKEKPEKVLEHAIKGMIPHNKLGKQVGMKLKIYKGENHPHIAQQPESLQF